MFPPETLFLTLLTLNIVCGFNEKQRNELKLNIETQKLRFHILNTEAQIHRFSEIMIQNISKMSVSAILLPYNWPCYSSAARSGRTKSQMWWFPSNHILLGLWFASCSLNPPEEAAVTEVEHTVVRRAALLGAGWLRSHGREIWNIDIIMIQTTTGWWLSYSFLQNILLMLPFPYSRAE